MLKNVIQYLEFPSNQITYLMEIKMFTEIPTYPVKELSMPMQVWIQLNELFLAESNHIEDVSN